MCLKESVPLPALCSPDFNKFMALIKSFLRAHKVAPPLYKLQSFLPFHVTLFKQTIKDNELVDVDRGNESLVETLRQQNISLEKDLSVLTAEHNLLKVKLHYCQ
jgi:hypothetical protein